MKNYLLPAGVKPCPFCGSLDLKLCGSFDSIAIECKCGAKIRIGTGLTFTDEDKTIQEVLGRWNSREGVKQNDI